MFLWKSRNRADNKPLARLKPSVDSVDRHDVVDTQPFTDSPRRVTLGNNIDSRDALRIGLDSARGDIGRGESQEGSSRRDASGVGPLAGSSIRAGDTIEVTATPAITAKPPTATADAITAISLVLRVHTSITS